MDGVPEAKEGHSTPLYFYGFAKKLAKENLSAKTSIKQVYIILFIYLLCIY